MEIVLGIDRFLKTGEKLLRGRSFALICGSANLDSSGTPVYFSLKQKFPDQLKAIWSLQHGFFVDKQDNMVLSPSFFWEKMGLEVRSLYGELLLPPPDWLQDIDVVVADVLDVGSRVYTFLNHLIMILPALFASGIEMIMLDRPNPINGHSLAGNVLEDSHVSIVGQVPVPMRHGLSAAEYVNFGRYFRQLDGQLTVVGVEGWSREETPAVTWTYPSPNMPTYHTALVYPGAVMLEGTNISEGRGTTRPFELVGAPFLDNYKIVELLRRYVKTVDLAPIFFKPEFSKFAGRLCRGLLVGPVYEETFDPFALYYELIRLVREFYPDDFSWREPPYEFELERLPIDMICASTLIRQAIEENRPYSDLNVEIRRQHNRYRREIKAHLLY